MVRVWKSGPLHLLSSVCCYLYYNVYFSVTYLTQYRAISRIEQKSKSIVRICHLMLPCVLISIYLHTYAIIEEI